MCRKILSEDSRERLVAAYEKTKDLANVAKMYGVAESTVYRLVAQKRKTGSLALKLSTRGVKSKLSPIMVEQIKQKIKKVPDITLQELIDELNLPIKASALCEFIVHKLKLTRKKRRYTPPKEIALK
jgi:transposase